MRFKLDENFAPRLASLLTQAGDQAETVWSEGLSGQSDEVVFQTCIKEGLAIVTLDLDFANPLRFPPGDTQGIIVLRPRRLTLAALRAALETAVTRLRTERVAGSLWIVEPARIRVYRPGEQPEEGAGP